MKKSSKRILNVGCGEDTYGTDFVDLYPSRSEVKKVDVDKEKLPYPDNTFDEVYSKNLLEHLRNPGFALEEMYRVLKKGGKLTIITDNAGFWEFHIFGTHVKPKINLKRLSFYKGRGELDTHYCLFTKEHLINHFKKLGIKIEEVIYLPFSSNEKLSKFRFLLNIIRKLLTLGGILENLAYPRIKIVGRKT
jgi:ubiquinone/menaquinone biosynthesis C-methylase UbiE